MCVFNICSVKCNIVVIFDVNVNVNVKYVYFSDLHLINSLSKFELMKSNAKITIMGVAKIIVETKCDLCLAGLTICS